MTARPLKILSPLFRRISSLLVVGAVATTAPARDIFVNPATGSNSANGIDAPVQTIDYGLKLAHAGDTVHLAPVVFKESALFRNRAGEPGNPIVLDGHGATLDGSVPLNPADWQEVAPGLYRTDHLVKTDDFVLIRWFFSFDGQLSHMGRKSKGTRAPFKEPAALQPGEWTCVPKENAFYVRIDPTKKLAECRITAPLRCNGVGFSGTNQHILVRNVCATHVYNDGFNIHGYTRAVAFENIRSVECGDDGFSAHEDCAVRVDGFASISNSTGICNIGNSASDNNRVLIQDCTSYDLFFMDNGRHAVRNSRVQSTATHAVVVTGGPGTNAICTLTLANVLIRRGTDTSDVTAAQNSVLEADRVTLLGLNVDARGSVVLRHSILTGAITLAPRVNWQADYNRYDLRFLRTVKTTYTPETFPDYQRTTGQDTNSRWQPLGANAPATNGCGADIASLPNP